MAIKNQRNILDTRVNQGEMFMVRHVQTAGAAPATYYYLIVTPASQQVHLHTLEFESDLTAAITIEIYEGATYSAAGTGLTEEKLDRRSTNTVSPQVTATHTPTTSADGTLLFTTILDAGRPLWNCIEKGVKLILPLSSNLHIKVIDAAGLTTVSMRAIWSEPRS